MKYYILITILVLATYLIRSSFILLGHKIKLSNDVKIGLSFLVIIILPAMIFPSMVFNYKPAQVYNERILASIFAIIISLITRNVIATMIGGFTILILLHQI